MSRIDDVELVNRDYATPDRLATRFKPFREYHQGPSLHDRIVHVLRRGGVEGRDAAADGTRPLRVLEVGAGEGGFSALLRDELGAQVTAVDFAPAMVERARARGIDAHVGDVQALPFGDDSFDVVVANWMLYHVPDLDQGLAELARVLRPEGRLVAATMGPGMMHELWDMIPDDGSTPDLGFSSVNGHEVLVRCFQTVERIDLSGSAVFPDRQAAVDYIHSTLTRGHLAEYLPLWEGPLRVTTTNAVFVGRDPIDAGELLAG